MYVLLFVVCLMNGHCEAAVVSKPFTYQQVCEREAQGYVEGYKNFREFPTDLIVYEKYTCVNFGELT